MKCLVIYSPFAKKGKINNYLTLIATVLQQKYEVSFAPTKYQNNAEYIASDACGQYDIIIAAGGDGIISEVVNGIAQKPNKPKLGILSLGTVNDIAHCFKIPKNINKALDIILTQKCRLIDIFQVNDKYAVYELSAGQFTNSTYETTQKSKRKLGRLAYFLKGFKNLFKISKINLNITLDNLTNINTCFTFVLMLNCSSTAGFNINKNACLDDGYIDVLLFKNSNKSFGRHIKNLFDMALLFIFGLKSLKNSKNVIISKAKQIEIKNSQRLLFNKDGEIGPNSEMINISVLQQEIEIIVP